MNELHEQIAERLRAALDAGISGATMKAVKKQTEQIIYDIESDLEWCIKDELAGGLVSFVCEMAKRTVEEILAGNEDQMRRYLGCDRGAWTGRSDSPQYGRKREDYEWHSVIHGKLFETGAIELRKKMVEAHRDLIANERILDLEDQVKSLVAQVNRAEAAKEEMWQRLRQYT